MLVALLASVSGLVRRFRFAVTAAFALGCLVPLTASASDPGRRPEDLGPFRPINRTPPDFEPLTGRVIANVGEPLRAARGAWLLVDGDTRYTRLWFSCRARCVPVGGGETYTPQCNARRCDVGARIRVLERAKNAGPVGMSELSAPTPPVTAAAPGCCAARDNDLLARFLPSFRFYGDWRPIEVGAALADAALEKNDVRVAGPPVSEDRLPTRGGGWRLNNVRCGGRDLACFARQSTRLASLPRIVYGRVWHGRRGATVLQYWLYYYFDSFENNKDALRTSRVHGFQMHEGDWEGVSVLLGATMEPISVALSHHCDSSLRLWDEVRKVRATHPVVHVAPGSQANYFSPGRHRARARCASGIRAAVLNGNAITVSFADYIFDLFPAREPLEVLEVGALRVRLAPPTWIVNVSNPPAWVFFAGAWGEENALVIDRPIRRSLRIGPGPGSPGHSRRWRRPLADFLGERA